MSENTASSRSFGSRSRRSTIAPYSASVSPSSRCGVLGVGHEAEDVPRAVRHPRDVARRAVRILALRVAEQHLPARLELVERPLGSVEATRGVLDGHRQAVALLARAGKWGGGVLHHELDLAADEAQARVGQQRAGQEAGL